jgi:hypothetical protein
LLHRGAGLYDGRLKIAGGEDIIVGGRKGEGQEEEKEERETHFRWNGRDEIGELEIRN